MAKEKATEYEFTTPVRMVWPALFEAKAYIDQKTQKYKGEPKFQATFLLDPNGSDLAALKAAAKAIAKAHSADFANTLFPFKDGDKLADKVAAKQKNGDYYRGTVVVRTDTKNPPLLAVFRDGEVSKGAIDLTPALTAQYQGWFYSGSLVIPVINLVWYDAVGDDGKPGVKAYLNTVVALNKGERIGGGKAASERFKGHVGQAVDENPLDDEIPF
jgi:hypothetical protein